MKAFAKAILLVLAVHGAGADNFFEKVLGQSAVSEAQVVEAVEPAAVVKETPLKDVRGAVQEFVAVDSSKSGKSPSSPNKSPSRPSPPASKSKKPRPTRRPTRPSPTPDSSKSRKTRRPTRRPSPTPDSSKSKKTRRPTRRPTGRRPSTSTKASKSTGRSGRCVDDERPSVRRSGTRYRFRLQRSSGGRCVDRDDRPYEYGQFRDVEDFSECADRCVREVRSSLLDSFRGYDYDCDRERCNCLYDRGTLSSSRSRSAFDRTSRSERGRGQVRSTERARGVYCARLTSSEMEGDAAAEAVGQIEEA